VGKTAGMKARKRQAGFTLIEILVVVAIIVLLATGMVKVAQTARTRAQERVTKGTISMLVSALAEYKNFHDRGSGFEFPEEPVVWNDKNEWLNLLSYGLRVDVANLFIDLGDHGQFTWEDDVDLDEMRLALATIEFLYCVMEDVPGCKAILEKLPVDVAVNDDNDSVTIRGQAKSLLEVNDAWGHPLWYEYRGPGNFPAITSAGPDGLFNTADDIVSTEF
jgi:prepilin-type N-terminal cleavage/methylation domain-containing protein